MRVREYNRREIAKLLGVTTPRVSQIATELGLKHRWVRGAYYYKLSDVRKMQARDTKPGPKNGAKK